MLCVVVVRGEFVEFIGSQSRVGAGENEREWWVLLRYEDI